MSAVRGAILGLMALLMLVGGGRYVLQQWDSERVRDYANVVTDTHTRAMAITKEARKMSDPLFAKLDAGRTVAPAEFAATAKAYRQAVSATREEARKLSRVVPPAAGRNLGATGLAFLEARAALADQTVEYLAELEKRARGDNGAATRAKELHDRLVAQARRIDAMALKLRDEKSRLALN